MKILILLMFVTFNSWGKTNPLVVVETTMGKIEIEIFQDKSPVTAKNFLRYVDEKFYDGTIFHRVINGFMIQGGGMLESMQEKKTHSPIKNEASTNGLSNVAGTIAMARTSDPNSATSQFFINVVDNLGLNAGVGNEGYAVFGKVVSGEHIVERIKSVKTGSKGRHRDVPVDPVVIRSIKRK